MGTGATLHGVPTWPPEATPPAPGMPVLPPLVEPPTADTVAPAPEPAGSLTLVHPATATASVRHTVARRDGDGKNLRRARTDTSARHLTAVSARNDGMRTLIAG